MHRIIEILRSETEANK